MAPEGEFAEAIPSAGQVKTWRSIQNPYGIHKIHKYSIVFTSIHKSYESHMSFEGILSFRPAPVPFRVVKARGSACSQFGKHPKFLVYMSPQSTSGNAICDRLYIYIYIVYSLMVGSTFRNSWPKSACREFRWYQVRSNWLRCANCSASITYQSGFSWLTGYLNG